MNYTLYKFLKDIQLRLRILVHGKPKLRVVIGSGGLFDAGWVPTNMETINASNEKDWNKYFREASIDTILGEHMWEHLTPAQSETTAAIIYKYLKPGGRLRLAMPDGFHPDPNYIRDVDVEKDPEALKRPEGHKVLYNYKTLQAQLEKAGFQVQLLEYYDEAGQFHVNEWRPEDGKIYRSERFKFERKDVSILCMPNYTSLIVDAFKRLQS